MYKVRNTAWKAKLVFALFHVERWQIIFYTNKMNYNYYQHGDSVDRFCGLVVSVADYKHRGPGSDSRALLRIFLRELGLERGPLSLVIG
jgi:hypothetical protein